MAKSLNELDFETIADELGAKIAFKGKAYENLPEDFKNIFLPAGGPNQTLQPKPGTTLTLQDKDEDDLKNGLYTFFRMPNNEGNFYIKEGQDKNGQLQRQMVFLIGSEKDIDSMVNTIRALGLQNSAAVNGQSLHALPEHLQAYAMKQFKAHGIEVKGYDQDAKKKHSVLAELASTALTAADSLTPTQPSQEKAGISPFQMKPNMDPTQK